MPLLAVHDLRVSFGQGAGAVQAVRGISFTIARGETLALVGESGSGKSLTALSILQLLPYPHAHHPSGSIRFEGQELRGAPESELQKIRGNKIAMIFQEPMTSLNPLHTIEKQIREVLLLHKNMTETQARARVLELLALVALPNAARRLTAYPHELSGGQRQRVMIAMALANDPALLIADEPTTALDVTVQAQILALLRSLQKETGSGILMITHNLGLVAENCHTVAVMYAGKVVEKANVHDIFKRPRHPYTQGLLRAVPRLQQAPKQPLPTIPGMVPNPLNLPVGCRFQKRCAFATDRCRQEQPTLESIGNGHSVACFVQPELSASNGSAGGI